MMGYLWDLAASMFLDSLAQPPKGTLTVTGDPAVQVPSPPPLKFVDRDTIKNSIRGMEYLLGVVRQIPEWHNNFPSLSPIQKTALAFYADMTEYEFPDASPIEVEILRELRKRG